MILFIDHTWNQNTKFMTDFIFTLLRSATPDFTCVSSSSSSPEAFLVFLSASRLWQAATLGDCICTWAMEEG